MAEAVVQGIDVSHYQGNINWSEVAKAEKAFAFIKATDGNGANDPLFAANWKEAGAAGVRRGAYHFFRSITPSLQQAEQFLARVRGDWGELSPVLDFEALGDATVEEALRGAKQWTEAVEAACGRKPILYTGPAFWSAVLNNPRLFAEHALWVAHYTAAARPKLPSPWKRWTFWQHSEKGLVPGIAGPVDLDRFNGTLTELDALCARIPEKSATAGS